MLLKALKRCPKSNKSPNLVTLLALLGKDMKAAAGCGSKKRKVQRGKARDDVNDDADADDDDG